MSQADSQWIEVEGCLRSSFTTSNALPSRLEGRVGELATGEGRLVFDAFKEAVNPEWVDGVLKVRGICFHLFNHQRQSYQTYLVVPEGERVFLEEPPKDLSLIPVIPIKSLLQFSLIDNYVHRVRIQGVVTYQNPGKLVCLHDGERGVFARTAQTNALKIGDGVSVLGFPAQGDYSPILEDATFERTVPQPQPLPTAIPVKSLKEAFEHDAEIVGGQAKLIGVLPQDGGWACSLQMDNFAIFTAFLAGSPKSKGDWGIELGSQLSFVGVCSVVMDSGINKNLLHSPQTIRLMLRSPADLKVIRRPPWWTVQRILIAAIVVVSLLIASLSLVVFSARTRLQDQAMARRQAEAAFTAVLTERNRMAREIHDTLAQDLSAISAHLQVVRRFIPDANAVALKHIDLAQAGARNSLQEARRSIWNMRSQVLEGRDLGTALAELLDQECRSAGVVSKFNLTGKPQRLASAVENDLLRIGQEAIHNAIRHAKPATVSMDLSYTDKRVGLCVSDDGKGFDLDQVQSTGGTRFGLKGMTERVRLNGGEIKIESHSGKGTQITLEIPLA